MKIIFQTETSATIVDPSYIQNINKIPELNQNNLTIISITIEMKMRENKILNVKCDPLTSVEVYNGVLNAIINSSEYGSNKEETAVFKVIEFAECITEINKSRYETDEEEMNELHRGLDMFLDHPFLKDMCSSLVKLAEGYAKNQDAIAEFLYSSKEMIDMGKPITEKSLSVGMEILSKWDKISPFIDFIIEGTLEANRIGEENTDGCPSDPQEGIIQSREIEFEEESIPDTLKP